jgi:NAD(P)-dependent dehydrogenase (short-subunit alcohol dehydrogenase family)
MAGEPAIVVTGASTGIGRACVATAVRRGAHVFATVRAQKDCDSLAQEFGPAVAPLIMDVTDEAAIKAAAAQVSARLGGRTLFGLVNNAGISVAGPLELLPAADFRRQVEINLVGQHAVTQTFLPMLGTDRARTGLPGRIVMISSVGGRDGQPFIGAYAASKHALEGYSKSLRRELMLFGVKVIVVAPGAVKTPIWDKSIPEDLSVYDGTAYAVPLARVRALAAGIGRSGLDPSVIADIVWRALTSRRPPRRISRVAGLLGLLQTTLPAGAIDAALAQRLELKPQR